MTAKRAAKASPIKPPRAVITTSGGYVTVVDGKAKKDKTRFADVVLVKGDGIVLDLGGAKVWCYTTEQYTEADKFQIKMKLARLLRGSVPWVSKKQVRELMKSV